MKRMQMAVVALLVLCTIGCASRPRYGTELTKDELAVLWNYHGSPGTVERAARICLMHQLAKADVLALTSDTMRREVRTDRVEFFFAPSQIWTLTFDENGKALAADITGRKITRDEAKESPNTASHGTALPRRP